MRSGNCRRKTYSTAARRGSRVPRRPLPPSTAARRHRNRGDALLRGSARDWSKNRELASTSCVAALSCLSAGEIITPILKFNTKLSLYSVFFLFFLCSETEVDRYADMYIKGSVYVWFLLL
uniref:Uncharacterized protein n=1 Tax=Noccaea caerulescens TaxID=107243 RepID=A0A1J3DFW3_NOCCA